MSEVPRSPERENQPPLDRKEIAVNLRQLGIEVDFEDWDGLDDNDVLGYVAQLGLMHGFDLDEILEASGIPIERREDTTGSHNFITGEEEAE